MNKKLKTDIVQEIHWHLVDDSGGPVFPGKYKVIMKNGKAMDLSCSYIGEGKTDSFFYEYLYCGADGYRVDDENHKQLMDDRDWLMLLRSEFKGNKYHRIWYIEEFEEETAGGEVCGTHAVYYFFNDPQYYMTTRIDKLTPDLSEGEETDGPD